MANAEIKTTSGAVISVSGTTEEVDEILAFWQRREDFFKRRRTYFRTFDQERNRDAHGTQIPFFSKKKSLVSPKALVIKLIENGFFKTHKTLSEVRGEIQKRFEKYIPNGSLHPTLILLISQQKLLREKLESGLWGYKEKENPKADTS